MSFKQNNTVTLNNYEEYFVLYMDNELNASQKTMVEAFVAKHPHLAEELDALVSLKLPPDRISFSGKEELLSPAMKLNAVDESLLLYVDGELPPAEKASVEERLASDKDYAFQHLLLQQTKLNAADRILHPHKKELYRHERRTVPFGFWMRMAAAVVLLLIGTRFFILDKGKGVSGSIVAKDQPVKNTTNTIKNKPTTVEQIIPKPAFPAEETVLTKQPAIKPLQNSGKTPAQKIEANKNSGDAPPDGYTATVPRREGIQVHATQYKITPNIPSLAVNKTIAPPGVTTAPDSSYNRQNGSGNNPEVEWAVETKKRAPARGFFRKVSRFIERNTGIGTVSDDNELLVGAVALKLK